MVYLELRNFLTESCDEHTLSSYDKIVDIAEKYELPDYMAVFDNTIGKSNQLDAQGIIDLITIDIRNIAIDLLQLQGIVLVDDIMLSALLEITDSIYEIVYYQDLNTIKDILNSELSNEETLGVILTLFTQYSTENLLSYIDSVNVDFKSNLKEAIKTREEVIVSSEIQSYIDAYKKYKEVLYQNEPCYCDKYLSTSSTIGMEYGVYFNQYLNDKEKVIADASNENLEIIAKDLIGLSLISSDAKGAALMVIKSKFSQMYSDMNTTTKLDILISKYVMKLNNQSM